jgi:hypothetical protein
MTVVGICSHCEGDVELTSDFGPDGTGPASHEAECPCGATRIPVEFFAAAGGRDAASSAPTRTDAA